MEFQSFPAVIFFCPKVKPKDLQPSLKDDMTVFQTSPLKKTAVHNVLVHVKKTKLKITSDREPLFRVCLNKACLLCSSPSSALGMGSFSLGCPKVDIHMVTTRLGIGVTRFPESDASRTLSIPPLIFLATEEWSEDSEEDFPLAHGKIERVY